MIAAAGHVVVMRHVLLELDLAPMSFGWPQFFFVLFSAVEVGFVALNHGKPRSHPYSLPSTLLTYAAIFTLLILGGFFR